MRPVIRIFLQALVLGLATGLCLAGGLALLYKALHPEFGGKGPFLYFFMVGGAMGLLAGWAFALEKVLDHLLSLLFKTVAQLVPLTAATIGQDWSNKIQIFFQEVLRPFPRLFQWIMIRFFVSRFKDPDRLNRALGKAQKQPGAGLASPEGLTRVILHYFLEPLTEVFLAVYVILFILTAIFWAIPFIG